ncbi:baseplate assembly protein [Halomonas sp. MES3-P3E]|uniref:baseplate assembly protein n=1 Tax=Halomonas sp. MES3-P3E TaxID=2058321 RepID=UPI000C322954|nr:baseplate J/gp47 family protein [Halomonas sp. MES3-P3E]PKG51257.1 baseplate assembly protein [Halomonas sp. MES3-P3E]
MSTPIDLSKLPAPTIIDPLDFEQLFEERKALLIELTPEAEREELAETLQLESEPLVKFLQESAYRELILRQLHNERTRSLLLAYAEGTILNHIGVTYYMTERLTLHEADPDAIPPVEAVMENDDDYKRRILLAHDAFSTAGGRNAYRYYALGADPQVKDADAIRPLAGMVQVYVLSREDDGEASLALIAAVESALNEDDVRPLSDTVRVTSASVLSFAVSAALELRNGPDADVVREEAIAAARDYVNQRHALGEVIVAGALESRLYVPGVERVTMASPLQDIGGDASEAPYCTAIEVTVSG